MLQLYAHNIEKAVAKKSIQIMRLLFTSILGSTQTKNTKFQNKLSLSNKFMPIILISCM